MTPAELASKIDHTILKPEATAPEVHRVVAEAVEHRFASACISPVFVARAAKQMKDTGVLVCTVIGFPHGTNNREFSYMVEYGMKPIDAIRAATVNAAGARTPRSSQAGHNRRRKNFLVITLAASGTASLAGGFRSLTRSR